MICPNCNHKTIPSDLAYCYDTHCDCLCGEWLKKEGLI